MNIYVGNLAREVTEEELKQEFTAFGEVTSVSIIKDKYSGQPRGYAFVEMASKSRGEAAITSLKGKKLRELVIDIVEALPLSDKRGIGSLQSGGSWFNRKGRQRRYQTS